MRTINRIMKEEYIIKEESDLYLELEPLCPNSSQKPLATPEDLRTWIARTEMCHNYDIHKILKTVLGGEGM